MWPGAFSKTVSRRSLEQAQALERAIGERHMYGSVIKNGTLVCSKIVQVIQQYEVH